MLQPLRVVKTEAKYEQITLGETICEKIKQIYYPNNSWSGSHAEVAHQFCLIKAQMHKLYTDKSDIEILQELVKYSAQDLGDILG